MTRSCRTCGTGFTPDRSTHVYCSPACRSRTAICKHCSRAFERHLSSDKKVYCSTACHHAAKSKRYSESPSDAQLLTRWQRKRWPASRIWPMDCAACGSRFNARKSVIRYCSDDCRRLAAGHIPRGSLIISTCACGQPFAFIFNSGALSRRRCPDCLRAGRLENRRTSKAIRRAKVRGVEHESIDPLAVFERDNWHCHICKRRIKRDLPDTHPGRATLDHLTPLADGGAHLLTNVAAAHRSCNMAKGAGSANDQLRLVG